jgi:hypothetical protein
MELAKGEWSEFVSTAEAWDFIVDILSEVASERVEGVR